ncbi:MAG TPA: chlorite dismutase family protein [Armatimonadota bacterium]|jgi:chlorite dismutase
MDLQQNKRQYVHFSFHRLDPAFRRLPRADKDEALREYADAMGTGGDDKMLFTYSLVGLRAEVDFMMWRIAYDTDALQAHTARLNHTMLAGYLTSPYAFLSQTKHSVYVDKHEHPGQEGRRLSLNPGTRKYLFIYPFLKTRPWYLLSKEERQKAMDVHIAVGHRFPSVKLNTTYSFGLDDQEFVVAFETNEPGDFLDLVMALRETESSLFTLRDTPIFTCVRQDIGDILASLA